SDNVWREAPIDHSSDNVRREAPIDHSSDNVLDDAYGKLNTVLVLTKSDLLPSAATKARLLEWSRRRARAGGIFEPIGVHLVSSHTGWGVQKLLSQLEELCGDEGEVWVMGAQNAGKSSLINAMSGYRGGTKSNKLLARAPVTASTMPGTTIGVVEVKNVLPAPHRMLDTPGLLHPHQLTPRLSPEEVKCVLPRRALKPRTYRLSKGAAIHIGGLARVDVEDCPGSTMYLTVWASSDIVCHFGKIDKAEELFQKHAGSLLQPPIGDAERLKELGRWEPFDVDVEGGSYKESTTDVAIGGVGWVGVGVVGTAQLTVWTYPGIGVTTRAALIPDFAKDLETPGWSHTVTAAAKKMKSAPGKTGNAKHTPRGKQGRPGKGKPGRK
ncbi:hypothetical protein CYMTET_55909, partial [Cymbomonas tetramitiformis]